MSQFGAAGEQSRPIYLVSMAGFPNYGDEVIAAAWLQFLARTSPDTDVWLDTRYPGSATALFSHLHPRLRTTDAVFRTVEDSRRGSRRDVEDIVQNLGTPLYDLQVHALREAGTIHLLGGGFLNSVWPENALIVRTVRAAARYSGARLIATGQGLMPDGGERFEHFDHVSVRDEPSARLLGLPTGLDDAFLMDPVSDGAVPGDGAGGSTRGRPLELVLCVQSDAQDDGVFARNVDVARHAVRRSGIPRERVRYLEAIPGNDFAGYDALRDVVADDGFVPFSALWRDGFVMGPHQVWVSTRFHHHLLAAAHGARGIALSGKAGYYDVKHGSVAALGSNWVISTGGHTDVPALEELREPANLFDQVIAKQAEASSLYR